MLRHAGFVSAILLAVGGSAQAADPVASIPDSARVIVAVDHPRTLAEAVTRLDAFKQAQGLPQYRQIYDSPTARQFFQLLAFAEKELGAQWPELLDQLAGNGIAIGIQFGPDAPAIAAASGANPKQTERAFDLGLRMLEQEVARQGNPDALKIERSGDKVVAHLGDDFHFARVGATILASNKADYLKEAIGRTKNAKENTTPKARAAIAKVLPKGALGWLWLDFATIKESKEAKDFFDSTRQDFIQTVAAGSTIDCVKRSAFVAVGLYSEGGGFRLRVRLPAGRDGLWPEMALHVPPKGSPGSLPLLEPPGTIYTQSFHLDIGYAWKNREKLIQGDVRKQLDMGEKAAAKFLPSDLKLGEILELWGPYHRIVIANHDKRPYKTEPGTKLPAFGYVATMRDKKFGENVETIVRAAAVLGALQFGWKPEESQYEGIAITSYRFPENKDLPDDEQKIRFNFEPCYAIVGDELVVASTVELCKKLIVELKKPKQKGAAALWQARVVASQGAEVVAGEPDALITDAILGRGVGLGQARQEVARLLDWVRTLGAIRIEIDMTASEYRLDVVWTPGKK